ncbi:MAG: thioredoxin family protein [Anaerolineales bacterium]|nr:thioredoxin family protein [Anaerolineales bacterium]
MEDVLLRAALAAAIAVAGWAAVHLLSRRAARRGEARLAELQPSGTASKVLVYFTTPSCVPCHTIQRPAIEQARRALGAALEVIEINAEAQPQLAGRWGVLSVPTTYLFNRRGEMKRANYGVVRAEKLLEQLQQL